MRRHFGKLIGGFLFVALAIAGYWGWRYYQVYQTVFGGYQHLRYLLESGETVKGAPAEDVLSDSYLLSLFGENPELVERLKTVVDLGMATDANLKLGSVSVMIVSYRKGENGQIQDAAIYAVGGFPDPKSKRLGFHSTGYFREELDADLWLTGNAIVNLLGRDIIVFCEQDKAEAHMALLFDLLQGHILPLAQSIVSSPLHYAIVFPNPGELAPPNLRTKLQTVILKGSMEADAGQTEAMLISATPRAAIQVATIFHDLLRLSRITFHDKFSGWIKEMPWGQMNDNWWAVAYVKLIDSMAVIHEHILVVARANYDRVINNAILKTVERAGRDIAMQKTFLLASDLPWEFAYREKDNPTLGYWGPQHVWGPEWPLGQDGIPTPGSIAEAAERERLRAEQEAERERLRQQEQQQQQAPPATPASG